MKIYEIGPYFLSITKKIQFDESGCKYILFRIDVYFTEYLLVVEVNEKGHTDRDLIFEDKRQKTLEKKLGCKFIRIKTSKKDCNAEYETSRVQTFVTEFKKKIKKIRKTIKQEIGESNKILEESNKKLEESNKK